MDEFSMPAGSMTCENDGIILEIVKNSERVVLKNQGRVLLSHVSFVLSYYPMLLLVYGGSGGYPGG